MSLGSDWLVSVTTACALLCFCVVEYGMELLFRLMSERCLRGTTLVKTAVKRG